MSDRILVVDDDDSFREIMAYYLSEEGYEVVKAANGLEGLDIFQQNPYPVVVTDLKMPGLDGLGLLSKILKINPDTLVVVITAFGDTETAVKAMKAGAFDFLPKPCEGDHFKLTIQRAVKHSLLSREVSELKNKLGSEGKPLIYNSENMERLIKLTDRVAESNATVLIEGESGTGKELIARRIHRLSGRKRNPFIAVNCGAIPKELLEDELFGHVKGAFTGAISNRKGKFLQANSGTIFLDEIAELAPELQTRFLRVLQEHVVDVIGKDEPVETDVRVIAATNKDLARTVAEGVFRQDLYYRLNVVPIKIPPLRERTGDIVTLVKYFLKQYSGGKKWEIPVEIIRHLEKMPWPGNIRELENLCQRITLLSEDARVTEDMLPEMEVFETGTSISQDSITLPKEGISLMELEKNIVLKAFQINGFNQSKTAKFLRIPRHVLIYRLEKFGISGKKSS